MAVALREGPGSSLIFVTSNFVSGVKYSKYTSVFRPVTQNSQCSDMIVTAVRPLSPIPSPQSSTTFFEPHLTCLAINEPIHQPPSNEHDDRRQRNNKNQFPCLFLKKTCIRQLRLIRAKSSTFLATIVAMESSPGRPAIQGNTSYFRPLPSSPNAINTITVDSSAMDIEHHSPTLPTTLLAFLSQLLFFRRLLLSTASRRYSPSICLHS